MFVDDGKGNGSRLGINRENRALTDSIIQTVSHHINHDEGLSYNVLLEVAPTANDDCIGYMENTSETDLIFTNAKISVSGACKVYFKINAKGTRNGPASLIPVALNSGSGIEADGVFESGADLDGGSATLSGGLRFDEIIYRGASDTAFYVTPQGIVLKKSGTLTVWCDTAGVLVTLNLGFDYHSVD